MAVDSHSSLTESISITFHSLHAKNTFPPMKHQLYLSHHIPLFSSHGRLDRRLSQSKEDGFWGGDSRWPAQLRHRAGKERAILLRVHWRTVTGYWKRQNIATDTVTSLVKTSQTLYKKNQVFHWRFLLYSHLLIFFFMFKLEVNDATYVDYLDQLIA